jgi:tRNA threonylcarbamoyladenosine biosynthesis protein TsaE
MAEYEGRLPFFHQDLYRLNGAEEVLGGGLVDERQEEGVTLIEWGERLPSALDPRRVLVRFEVGDGDQRLITVETMGSQGARYVGAARTWSAR